MSTVPPPAVVCDARMLRNSGIGTYLRATLPRVCTRTPHWDWQVIHRPGDRDWAAAALPGVRLVCSDLPIYGIAEQRLALQVPRPAGSLWWSPHYNLPLLHRGPLVATVHDVLHLAQPELFGGLATRIYARLMFAALARRARIVMCDSEFTREEFRRLNGRVRADLRVVLLAVAPPPPRTTAGPAGDAFFLCVGNVKPHKNLARLIRAFASVADELPQRLVIVGRREGFRAADHEVGVLADRLGSRVEFTGEVGDAELQSWYARANALVHPSYYEGFGLPPLEAMAAGCPVLVSRAASLPEVCGDAALYFDPFSEAEIAAALSVCAHWTAEERDTWRERGLRQAASFSWDRTSAAIVSVLEEAMNPGRTA